MSQTMEWMEDRVCTVCGKRFSVLYPHLWRYKEPCGGNGHYRYFCSWKCLRANEKNQKEKTDMEKMKKDGTPAKKPGPKPKEKTETAVPEVTVSGALKIRTDEPEKVEVKGRISKPVNYAGYEITAIREPKLGEFYYDKKFNSIDWRTEEGDEVSMPPWLWRRLYDKMPEMFGILGVIGDDPSDP